MKLKWVILGICLVAISFVMLAPVIPTQYWTWCDFGCASAIPVGAQLHANGERVTWTFVESISLRMFGYGGYYSPYGYYFGSIGNLSLFLSGSSFILLILPIILISAVPVMIGLRKSNKVTRTEISPSLER